MGNHVIGEPDILIKKTKTKKSLTHLKGPNTKELRVMNNILHLLLSGQHRLQRSCIVADIGF